MEALLPHTVKVIVLSLIAIVIVLAWLARVFPQAAWLRIFRFPAITLSPDQRERHRRSGNRLAAMEMVVEDGPHPLPSPAGREGGARPYLRNSMVRPPPGAGSSTGPYRSLRRNDRYTGVSNFRDETRFPDESIWRAKVAELNRPSGS